MGNNFNKQPFSSTSLYFKKKSHSFARLHEIVDNISPTYTKQTYTLCLPN